MENEKIQKMQAARKAALAGRSPREVGREKANAALLWVYRWGFTSPTILNLVGGSNRTGLSARLVRQGFLAQTPTEGGGFSLDVPIHILTLTKAGVEQVVSQLKSEEQFLPYKVDPYRSLKANFRHDLKAQMATAKALISNKIKSYQSEKELRVRSEEGAKVPDVVWTYADNTSTAVEVELSPKWSRDLDQFVLACLEGLGGPKPRFTQVAIVSPSPAILQRYKAAFEPGNVVSRWKKGADQRWVKEGAFTVSAQASEKILWQKI